MPTGPQEALPMSGLAVDLDQPCRHVAEMERHTVFELRQNRRLGTSFYNLYVHDKLNEADTRPN